MYQSQLSKLAINFTVTAKKLIWSFDLYIICTLFTRMYDGKICKIVILSFDKRLKSRIIRGVGDKKNYSWGGG